MIDVSDSNLYEDEFLADAYADLARIESLFNDDSYDWSLFDG